MIKELHKKPGEMKLSFDMYPKFWTHIYELG